MKKLFSTIVATALVASAFAVTPHFGLEFGYDHADRYCKSNIPDKYWDIETGKLANYSLDGFHIGGNVQLDFLDGANIPSLVIGLNYQFLGSNHYGISASKAKENKQDAIDYLKAIGAENIEYNSYFSAHSLQIPIRVQYTHEFANEMRLMAFTGPQIRLHIAEREDFKEVCTIDGKKEGYKQVSDYISGKCTETSWNEGKKDVDKWNMYEDEDGNIDKDDCQPIFDLSWGIGVGFGWKNLSLNISYDLGLCNMTTKSRKQALEKLNSSLDTNYKYALYDNTLAVTLGYRF